MLLAVKDEALFYVVKLTIVYLPYFDEINFTTL